MIDTVETQDGVFAFLQRPSTHGGARVRRIDTHAAAVFLAGERAYKVKRAVRFPFLDFSTLERRRAACNPEIEANRPFAPGLYRGVIAITCEKDGELSLGGVGEPVEWAVEMHRFDEAKTLDRLADRGAVDLTLADSLARTVAAAHARAPAVDAAPWIDALGAYVEQRQESYALGPMDWSVIDASGTPAQTLSRAKDVIIRETVCKTGPS
jgi:aminoglycoside phosphotransferase family enzyme